MKRFIDWLKSLFSKKQKPTTENPMPPILPPIVAKPKSEVLKAIEWIRYANPPGYVIPLQEVIIKVGRNLTAEEMAEAIANGVFVRKDEAVTGELPDFSGMDLTDGKTGYKLYKLANGEKKQVMFNRSGTIKIVGYAGTQLLSVTDGRGTHDVAGTVGGYTAYVVGPSFYTFSVESVGGDIFVQHLPLV